MDTDGTFRSDCGGSVYSRPPHAPSDQRALRVIVLSGGSSFAADELADIDAACCTRVSGPYEAAAEIMAQTPAALVIDLRGFSASHVRLVDLARREGTETLAVGSLPRDVGADELSGVRLVSRRDLTWALRRLVAFGVRAEETNRADGLGSVSRPAEADTPQSPQDLLTSDEITALLEDED